MNAASYVPGLVPGSLATVFAAGVLDDSAVVGADRIPLPLSLRGVSITVDGIPAPILTVANSNGQEQVNFQAPFEISLQQWNTAFHSQATAFLVAAQSAASLLRDNGRVIAITYGTGSKTGGMLPWVGMGAAKAALETLVRYVAVALARRGITVNAVSPGWTEDSVLNTLPGAVQDLIRGWHERGWTPMGRLGTPADVGNVVSLLCQEEAGWITGQVIFADGGASLMNPEMPSEIQLVQPASA